MSDNYYSSENFQYTQLNNSTSLQNDARFDKITDILLKIQKENRILKAEVVELKLSITKLAEEVITVKLENRKLHSTRGQHTDDLPDFRSLPFTNINEITNFDNDVQQDNENYNNLNNL
ncbi:uncharacterized protein LOC127565060 [Drosophila albomicans]|uniref:Uncharacterized protein LOC127565060 n=1 Tax=Drosophila albomicans TaxID=7291 RepID=A0A9C6WCM8_DROAB|nr:uncharacterized protein LOC127565060 [Drosophila albomicans]